MNTPHRLIVASLFLLGSWNNAVLGQVECAAPGNLRGIRVDGELMAFSTSIRAVVPTPADEAQGGRGRGGGGRGRGGAPAAGVSYRATFKDVAPGTVDAEIQITATSKFPFPSAWEI